MVNMFGYQDWMTPEEKERLKSNQIMSMAAELMKSSAPSTDPRNANMAYALGQAMQSGLGARQQTTADLMRGRQFAQQQELQKAMQDVPRHTSVPAVGPPTAGGQYPTAAGPLRPMSEYLGDLGETMMRHGQVGPGAQLLKATQTGETEPYKKGHVKEFRVGDEIITREYQGAGEWKQLARSPRWDTKETTPAQLQIFEAASSELTKADRGTPEYEKAFAEFRDNMYTGKSILGTTPDGNLLTFNPKTQRIDTINIDSDILPKTKKIISESTIKDISVTDNLLGGIDEIRKIAKDNPQFLGPVDGTWNKIKSKFFENKDFTALDREIESLITMAYGLSGKQISIQEMKMLKRAILPSVTQPDANFVVSLDHAEKWLNRNRGGKIKHLKSSGYRVSPELEKTRKKKEDEEQYDYEYIPGRGLVPVQR